MERSEILTEDWLVECWKERNNRTLNMLDADFIRKYRAKPLHNLCLFFYGTSDDTEQHHLHTLTLDNGKRRDSNCPNMVSPFSIQVDIRRLRFRTPPMLYFVMEWM